MKRFIAIISLVLILLCAVGDASQFAVVDFDPTQYSIEELEEIKSIIDDYLSRNKTDAEVIEGQQPRKEESPINDFLYVSNGTEVCINAYIGNGGDVVIPNYIDGCKVTKIADRAFHDNGSTVTSLSLPQYLRSIGHSQFPYGSVLSNVLILPEGLDTTFRIFR